MIGFTYLWRDRRDHRFYLGSHVGTFDENYISGSEVFLNEYKRRPEDFRRRILRCFEDGDWEQVRQEEARLLAMLRPKKLGGRYYNKSFLASGGLGRVRVDIRMNMSAGAKRRFENPDERRAQRDRQLKRFSRPEEREKTSIRTSAAMADPAISAKVSKAQRLRYSRPEERDKQRRCGALASHNRWHVGRGLVNPACTFCAG